MGIPMASKKSVDPTTVLILFRNRIESYKPGEKITYGGVENLFRNGLYVFGVAQLFIFLCFVLFCLLCVHNIVIILIYPSVFSNVY